MTDFQKFGLKKELIEVLNENNYLTPTDVQNKCIPKILSMKNVLAISETGSGKTLAFAVPIINNIIKTNQYYHSLIISPTRELAKQTESVFKQLGSAIGLNVQCIIGGECEKAQKRNLFQSQHVIIGTPGRLSLVMESIHLFKNLQYIVLDECDKLLEKDYKVDIEKILTETSKEKKILMFSATKTKLMEDFSSKLGNTVTIECCKPYDTLGTLKQQYVFLPAKFKRQGLINIVKNFEQKTLVFVTSCLASQTINLFLEKQGCKSMAIHGLMKQEKRNKIIKSFRELEGGILVATDLAARGLDIENVLYVINYDLPKNINDYIHRIGRTARAGKNGEVINFVTQYEIDVFQKIERLLNIEMTKYIIDNQGDKEEIKETEKLYKESYNEIKTLCADGAIKKRKKNR